MKMKELWKSELNFEDRAFPNWKNLPETYWTNALAGEAGELCNASKKRRGGGTNNYKISKDEMLEETVDVYIYTILLVSSLGYTYEDFKNMLQSKIEKNYGRLEDGKVVGIKE